MAVLIQGHGLAAHACAAALARRDLSVRWIPERGRPTDGPQLVLNDVCLSLLNDLFPRWSQRKAGRPLRGRVVRWADEPLARIASPCLSITTADLIGALGRGLPCESARLPVGASNDDVDWVVAAGTVRGLPARQRIEAGTRCIATWDVELTTLDANWYYVESVPSGWLMLTPTSPRRGRLQAMLPGTAHVERRVDEMLRASALISPGIRSEQPPTVYPAAPYIVLPLAGRDWLGIGTQATRFDPISGEGSALGIRSALLGAALIADLHTGRIDFASGLAHVEHRLALTFLSHLESCADLYARAFSADVGWREELRRCAQAHRQVRELVNPPASEELPYTLHGLTLEKARGSRASQQHA